jgi:acetyltransferase-like isoleucine patch superfamily enzyme
MKRMLQQMLIGGLTPIFQGLDAIGQTCRLSGWSRMIRQARWKTRLAALGEDTVIYPSVVIHGPEQVQIGARCSIAEFVHMWGGGNITIGNDVLIASHTVITSLTHDKDAVCFRETTLRAPVVIGDNVWICAGAIILPGVTVGSGSIVGAGAVVTRDVPAGAMVVGAPAKPSGGIGVDELHEASDR